MMALCRKALMQLGLSTLVLCAVSANAQTSARASHEPMAAPGVEKLLPGALATCRALAIERSVLCQPLAAERRKLADGVAYYKLLVKVGPGIHDVIAVHRVIAERKPGHPKKSKQAVFMIHGDLFGFEAAFLGPVKYADPPEEALPTFLARHRVDVWGISFRWAQIPPGFPDSSFMAGWGLDTAISDARIALRLARAVRRATGQGVSRIHLLGWSSGAWTIMALANAEATEPHWKRDIGGLIPVDGAYKVGPEHEGYRQLSCADNAAYQGLLDTGQFGIDWGYQPVGQLALDAPDDPSPFFDGLTNAQFAMGAGSWPYDLPGFEWFHGVAGTFDEQGTPTGLVYTDPLVWFRLVSNVFGYDPVPYLADMSAVSCDEVDVPWDDHLAEVRVPLFYVGAGGGFSTIGVYLTQIVGSDDTQALVVSEQPPELSWLDIGHADIFLAPASRKLFWRPILTWLKSH